MRFHHQPPPDPFPAPRPLSERAREALLFLPRLFLVGLSILAAAVYFFVVNPDEPDEQP